jgi:hypothetical protein
MNIFLKGPSGNATPASQNLGSDYCCSGTGSKKQSQKRQPTLASMITQGTF